MCRLPALHRRAFRYLWPPGASDIIRLTLYRRHGLVLLVSQLYRAIGRADDPRRGRRRHHCSHHGDIQRHYPSSTKTQVLEYHSDYVGLWDHHRATGRRTVCAAHFLEMGLHHQSPLLCLGSGNRATGRQAAIQKKLRQRKTPASRLVWRLHLCGELHQLFDGAYLGWSPIPLEQFPNSSPSRFRRTGHWGNVRLGNVGS